MQSIKETLQENLDDYSLKTNKELIDKLTDFGSGETEFHTADIERVVVENERAKNAIDRSIKKWTEKKEQLQSQINKDIATRHFKEAFVHGIESDTISLFIQELQEMKNQF